MSRLSGTSQSDGIVHLWHTSDGITDMILSQLRALKPLIESLSASSPAHPSLPLLRDILTEFRDDELEHLDTAVEEGAQKAPGHALLSAIIGAGCKVAIKICERI